MECRNRLPPLCAVQSGSLLRPNLRFAPSKVEVCAVQTQGLRRPNPEFAPSKVTQKILTPPLPLPYMGAEYLRTDHVPYMGEGFFMRQQLPSLVGEGQGWGD